MQKLVRGGFTLVELMVVVSIIAAILIIITPTLQKAIVTSKTKAARTNVALVDSSIHSFASGAEGTYPGLAIDMVAQAAQGATKPVHVLGDPDYTTANVMPFQRSGWGSGAVLGGVCHANATNLGAGAQIDRLREQLRFGVVAANGAAARSFDVVRQYDRVTDYPQNAFGGWQMINQRTMRNIFLFSINIEGLTPEGLTDPAIMSDPNFIDAMIYCSNKPVNGAVPAGSSPAYDNPGAFVYRVNQTVDPAVTDVQLRTALQAFNANIGFGSGDNALFSEGDFAYVPVLTASTFPLSDDPTTLVNERYRWGSSVGSYWLFSYGARASRYSATATKARDEALFEEQLQFARNGIDGIGAKGADTTYEWTVLALFKGAIWCNGGNPNASPAEKS